MRTKIFFLFLGAVTLMQSQNIGIPLEGLQGFWSFQGDLTDYSGNKHNGTGHNVKFVVDRFGNKDYACAFNGINSYVSTTYEGILGDKPRTVSFWLLPKPPMKSQSILMWGDDSLFPNNGGLFECSLDWPLSTLFFCVADAGVGFKSNCNPSDGKWHHYIYRFNGLFAKEIEIYEDGVLLTHMISKIYPNTLVRTRRNYNLTIGRLCDYDSLSFRGYLDDVAIYDRALSPDEISALYHAPDPLPKTSYASWLLYFLGTAMVVFIIVLLVRLRIKILVKRKNAQIQLERKWFEQESRVLRAQIDPLFISNSLNTIEQFIQTEDNDKAQLYLSTFSQLIRMQLESNTSENISLAQEIEIVEKYLEVESLRFNHIFDYELQVDKALDTSIHIPYFLIQPFLENVIYEGLLPKSGYKELDLKFERCDDRTLLCVIEDNGIERNVLQQTLSEKQRTGISFAQQRLSIFSRIEKHQYGVEQCKKEGEAAGPKGMRIIIKIPVLSQ